MPRTDDGQVRTFTALSNSPSPSTLQPSCSTMLADLPMTILFGSILGVAFSQSLLPCCPGKDKQTTSPGSHSTTPSPIIQRFPAIPTHAESKWDTQSRNCWNSEYSSMLRPHNSCMALSSSSSPLHTAKTAALQHSQSQLGPCVHRGLLHLRLHSPSDTVTLTSDLPTQLLSLGNSTHIIIHLENVKLRDLFKERGTGLASLTAKSSALKKVKKVFGSVKNFTIVQNIFFCFFLFVWCLFFVLFCWLFVLFCFSVQIQLSWNLLSRPSWPRTQSCKISL